jgi:hypothetical protein
LNSGSAGRIQRRQPSLALDRPLWSLSTFDRPPIILLIGCLEVADKDRSPDTVARIYQASRNLPLNV